MQDPNVKRLLWFLFAGSKGGENRTRIIDMLIVQPRNINQLSEFLNLDYKAVQHHIAVLEKNNLVIRTGEKYGILCFISDFLENNMQSYIEVRSKIRH